MGDAEPCDHLFHRLFVLNVDEVHLLSLLDELLLVVVELRLNLSQLRGGFLKVHFKILVVGHQPVNLGLHLVFNDLR